MTMRDALEFANDVAEAFLVGFGSSDMPPPPLGMSPVAVLGIPIEDRVKLMEIDTNGDHREAVLRDVLSDRFSEQEVTDLLALRPSASEAATFARALLTAAARTPVRQLRTSFENEKRSFAVRYMSQFLHRLQIKYAPGHDVAEGQAPVH